MSTASLAIRASDDLVVETGQLAELVGLSRSDYIRHAIEEKNARVLAERMVYLSRQLSTQHLTLNEAMGDSLGDGLADR